MLAAGGSRVFPSIFDFRVYFGRQVNGQRSGGISKHIKKIASRPAHLTPALQLYESYVSYPPSVLCCVLQMYIDCVASCVTNVRSYTGIEEARSNASTRADSFTVTPFGSVACAPHKHLATFL